MARGGRRDAEHLKVLRGTDQPCRQNPDEPVVEGKPDRPKRFTARSAARRLWDELLAIAYWLTPADQEIAALYVEAQLDYQRLRKDVAKEGEVLKGSKGGKVRNPKTILLREVEDRLRKCSVELGLTPASRSRVKAKPRPQANPWKTV